MSVIQLKIIFYNRLSEESGFCYICRIFPIKRDKTIILNTSITLILFRFHFHFM